MTDKSQPAKRTPKLKPTSQDTSPVTNQTVDELAYVVEHSSSRSWFYARRSTKLASTCNGRFASAWSSRFRSPRSQVCPAIRWSKTLPNE